MDRLKKRRDFLKVQKGRRVHTGLFSLQALARGDADPSRVGFTVSKRVSPSAVRRNRIRRRLKEAVRILETGPWAAGSDFVIVARSEVLAAPFSRVLSDIGSALTKASPRHPNDISAVHARKP